MTDTDQPQQREYTIYFRFNKDDYKWSAPILANSARHAMELVIKNDTFISNQIRFISNQIRIVKVVSTDELMELHI
jgi:hypothetical protein